MTYTTAFTLEEDVERGFDADLSSFGAKSQYHPTVRFKQVPRAVRRTGVQVSNCRSNRNKWNWLHVHLAISIRSRGMQLQYI